MFTGRKSTVGPWEKRRINRGFAAEKNSFCGAQCNNSAILNNNNDDK